MNAASISACLRRGGLHPLGSGSRRDREGIRVRNSYGGHVRISIDVDSSRELAALTADVAQILTAAGYEHTRETITATGGDIETFTVTGKTQPKPTVKWERIDNGNELGYSALNGRIEVTDNGGGIGPAAGSRRWAVSVDGRWIVNIDTLTEAKQRALTEAGASD